MSIEPNWMKGRKERSAHLEDNDNHVIDTAYVGHTGSTEVTLQRLPKFKGFRGFVESMIEQIILEGKPFESYKDELKSQCKAEGVDYENLVYDLEDFIEELSIGLGSSDGLAAAMGIGFALMDAEKFYIRREKIEEIYDIWDQRYPNRVIHLHNPIELGTNDNNS